FVEMVQPEGRATVKVVERFKGEVPDNVEVMFPPMILVSNPTSGLPEVPVSPGETYVLSTISSRESDLLSVLPRSEERRVGRDWSSDVCSSDLLSRWSSPKAAPPSRWSSGLKAKSPTTSK